MKKIIYTLLASVALLSSCMKGDLTAGDSLTTEEGKVTMELDLSIKGSELQDVATRAGEEFAGQAKENVTSIKGYAFVFSEDNTTDDQYGDNSVLLQKVAFKTVEINGKAKVFITLDEQEDPCFIRLMSCMTDAVYNEMNSFVSQKMIDEGDASAPATLFKDYKYISVGLDEYYASAENPNPTALTTKTAFPLASPGINMDNGITQNEVDKVNEVIFMVPVAAKVDVSADKSIFTLSEVTLLNGAKRARMRSTVLEGDGVHTIHNLPLPINLGGVTKYLPLSADKATNSTAGNPIYFFPNEGDGPFDNPLDATEEDYENLSDENKGNNPTYLIIKGTAAGYNVEGYYKIPIRYQLTTVNPDGSTSTATDFTYDIVRNNHYKIRLIYVGNPGYSTKEEAEAGPANDVVYDIVIDDSTTDDRNELIVSNNGTHYMEVKGSEVFIKARSGAEGVNCSLDFKFVSASNIPEYDEADEIMPKVYFSTTDKNITLTTSELAVAYQENKTFTLNFNVKSSGANVATSGDIIVRWGELYKKIPVNYENVHALSGVTTNASVNSKAIFNDAATIEGKVNDVNGTHTTPADIANFVSGGNIVANTTYNGRNFDGYVYPTDRSQGIRRVYYAQASNFELIDETKGSEALLWSAKGSKTQSIVYRSTGTIFSITDGATNTSGIRNYTVKGDINSNYDGGFSNFKQVGWGNSKKFSFEAIPIGTNQPGPTYKPEKSHLSNTATLTLTNFADEKKIYKFQVDQYALPYIEGVSEDSSGRMIFWGGTADMYGAFTNNKKENLNKVYINNAYYTEKENKGNINELGYHWQDTSFNYWYYNLSGNNTQKSCGYVYYAIAAQHDEIDANNKKKDGTNRHQFYGYVNNKSGSSGRTGEGYFVLTIGNKAEEKVQLYMHFKRKD